MGKPERIKYWIDIANYDMETAEAMLHSKRYLYVGFMCHQAIEKMLKAYFSSISDDIPPYTHNLKQLAVKTGLYDKLSSESILTINTLLPLNVEARYPTYKEQLLKSLTYERCVEIIDRTVKLKKWIKQQL